MSRDAGRARGGIGQFRAAYAAALRGYRSDASESSLRAAYELGREAVSRELSVLDLAAIHQEIVSALLTDASDLTEAQRSARAASDFFLESLSSFEMVQRGFKEARQAFLDERRLTELSRRLSTFLADASLALEASDSLQEMLTLVAEQARELVQADCCIVTVASERRVRSAEAASYAEPAKRWRTLLAWLDLVGIYELLSRNGGSIRIAGAPLARMAMFDDARVDTPLRGWLASSLTTLDGGQLGAVQLFDKRDGDFAGEDEAALIHLTQMASAAVERARLYQQGSRDHPRGWC